MVAAMIGEMSLGQQAEQLEAGHPGLAVTRCPGGGLVISGYVRFESTFEKVTIRDQYLIQIDVPSSFPIELPVVKELGQRIPVHSDYHVGIVDGALCLGAPLEIRRRLKAKPTLEGVLDLVISFLFGHSFKEKTGRYPFGELFHGGKGLLQYYGDLFGVQSVKLVIQFMEVLISDSVMAHRRCPCGSRRRIPKCHGVLLSELKRLQSKSQFEYEFEMMRTFLQTNNPGPTAAR